MKKENEFQKKQVHIWTAMVGGVALLFFIFMHICYVMITVSLRDTDPKVLMEVWESLQKTHDFNVVQWLILHYRISSVQLIEVVLCGLFAIFVSMIFTRYFKYFSVVLTEKVTDMVSSKEGIHQIQNEIVEAFAEIDSTKDRQANLNRLANMGAALYEEAVKKMKQHVDDPEKIRQISEEFEERLDELRKEMENL